MPAMPLDMTKVSMQTMVKPAKIALWYLRNEFNGCKAMLDPLVAARRYYAEARGRGLTVGKLV